MLTKLATSSIRVKAYTGELGYDGPLYDGFLHMTDNMLGPIEYVLSKFACIEEGLEESEGNVVLRLQVFSNPVMLYL